MFEDFGTYDGVFQSIFDSQFSQILYEYEVAVVKSNANKIFFEEPKSKYSKYLVKLRSGHVKNPLPDHM